jgi:hypothetical protein
MQLKMERSVVLLTYKISINHEIFLGYYGSYKRYQSLR